MNFKRLFSLLLIFTLMFTMVACSEDKTEVKTPEGSQPSGEGQTSDPPENDEPEYLNMGGITIKLVASYGHEESESFLGYRPDTLLNDKARERVNTLQNRHNLNLDIRYTVIGTNSTDLAAATASGLFYTNIYQNETFAMLNEKKESYFLGYNGLSEYIDIKDSAKWGGANMLMSACWGDQVYAVFPCAWPEQMLSSFGYPVVVNNDLLKEAGLSDLREYVENGTWNWDNFTATLKAARMQDGDRITYGMAVHAPYLMQNFVLANGVKVAVKDETSETGYVPGYLTDAAERAMEFVRNMYMVDFADCFDKTNTSPAASAEAFINEDAVMLMIHSGSIFGVSGKIMYELDNIAVLPVPYGPDAGIEGSYNTFHESLINAIALPVNQGDLENEDTAFVLNELFSPFEGLSTHDELQAYYTENIFFDSKDYNYYEKLMLGSQYNFYNEGARSMLEGIVNKKNKTTAELMQTYESQITKKVAQNIAPVFAANEAVFGTTAE